MNKIRCENCGAVYNQPPGRTMAEINAGYHCQRCLSHKFKPVVPLSSEQVGAGVMSGIAGATFGAMLGGPAGAVVGGALGFAVGSKR